MSATTDIFILISEDTWFQIECQKRDFWVHENTNKMYQNILASPSNFSQFVFDVVFSNDQLIHRNYLLNLNCVWELSVQTFGPLYTARSKNFIN